MAADRRNRDPADLLAAQDLTRRRRSHKGTDRLRREFSAQLFAKFSVREGGPGNRVPSGEIFDP